jgi:putative sterol carrier protein
VQAAAPSGPLTAVAPAGIAAEQAGSAGVLLHPPDTAIAAPINEAKTTCFMTAHCTKVRTMPFTFPSAEWAAEFKKQVEASTAYRQAAATWTFGPVALLTKADPGLGLAEDVGMWLDVDRGNCKDVRMVPRAEAEAAPFCISGDYARWKSVLRRELDPVKAMMQKKLELKGQMTTIIKYVNASKELVECAARVPTRFLDDK